LHHQEQTSIQHPTSNAEHPKKARLPDAGQFSALPGTGPDAGLGVGYCLVGCWMFPPISWFVEETHKLLLPACNPFSGAILRGTECKCTKNPVQFAQYFCWSLVSSRKLAFVLDE
jgi:hypothetical protein